MENNGMIVEQTTAKTVVDKTWIAEAITEYLSITEDDGAVLCDEQTVDALLHAELPVIEWFEKQGTKVQQAIVKDYLKAQTSFRDKVHDEVSKSIWHFLAERFFEQHHKGHRARHEFLCCLRNLQEDVCFRQLFLCPRPVARAMRRIMKTRSAFKSMCQEVLQKFDGDQQPGEIAAAD